MNNLIKALPVCTLVLIANLNCAFAQKPETVIKIKPDSTLSVYRKQIDSIDNHLIHLLGERQRVVSAVGIYKAKNHIPALQASRFQEVVDKGIIAGKHEGLSAGYITEILNIIHKESLRIENLLKK